MLPYVVFLCSFSEYGPRMSILPREVELALERTVMLGVKCEALSTVAKTGYRAIISSYIVFILREASST